MKTKSRHDLSFSSTGMFYFIFFLTMHGLVEEDLIIIIHKWKFIDGMLILIYFLFLSFLCSWENCSWDVIKSQQSLSTSIHCFEKERAIKSIEWCWIVDLKAMRWCASFDWLYWEWNPYRGGKAIFDCTISTLASMFPGCKLSVTSVADWCTSNHARLNRSTTTDNF